MNKGRLDRDALTPEQRRLAAEFFPDVAGRTKGKFKEAAAAFNRHRADFLEGKTNEIPSALRDFIQRHNLPER